ncbi:MAG: 50S ribosomal protein L19 [Dehalococcoidales bacterium]
MNVATLIEIKKNPKIPDIAPGDTVKVSVRIVEGGKERIQIFQGVIIKIKHGGIGASFTVRHVAFGIGVERTFPFNSSLVEKVEIIRQGKVRRSRLYYLRGLSGKEARRKIKRVERKVRQVGEELLQAPPEEVMEPMLAEAVGEKVAEAAAAAPAQAEAKAPEAAVETKPAAEKAPAKEAAAAVKKEKAPKAAKAEEAAKESPAAPPAEEKKAE